jgi:hypothetical protein
LAIPEEFDDFVTDFKATKAQCYLKTYLREVREAYENGQSLTSSTVDKKLLQVAYDVSFKRVRDLDEMIDDPTAFGALVSDSEWKILAADELTEESLAQKKHVDWMKKNDTKMAIKKKKKRKAKKAAKKISSLENEDAEYGFEDDAAEDDDDENNDVDATDKRIC